ncbi:hypothetical protein Q8A67_018239 [Cirrhinus molitorella]|nr:hypothetical protein Q8A67_018239 [Cirrhinus molitorella]
MSCVEPRVPRWVEAGDRRGMLGRWFIRVGVPLHYSSGPTGVPSSSDCMPSALISAAPTPPVPHSISWATPGSSEWSVGFAEEEEDEEEAAVDQKSPVLVFN